MVQYDEQRNLIGTDAGVLWFDGKVFFPFDNKNPFIGFQINCISKLVDGSVLIGVKDALWLYKKDRNSFKAPVPLLKNLSIYNILIDDEKLWIATSKGSIISMIAKASKVIPQKFTCQDSLQYR